MRADRRKLVLAAVVAVALVGAFFLSGRDRASAERTARIRQALSTQGCREDPVVGGHVPSLNRSEGKGTARRSLFTYEVAACGAKWHVELASGARDEVTGIQKLP